MRMPSCYDILGCCKNLLLNGYIIPQAYNAQRKINYNPDYKDFKNFYYPVSKIPVLFHFRIKRPQLSRGQETR